MGDFDVLAVVDMFLVLLDPLSVGRHSKSTVFVLLIIDVMEV